MHLRHRYEAERAREERRKQVEDEWRRQRQAQATPEQRAYRQMSVQEREQQIRKALGLSGAWPNYLRLYNKHNYAIDAPFQLWQSAAFHRFVFKKPILTTTLFTTDIAQWVLDWFGPAIDDHVSR
jgi:predicted Rossmann fold nucleotide-binding protein DprA/Smf involved in DNA uptake